MRGEGTTRGVGTTRARHALAVSAVLALLALPALAGCAGLAPLRPAAPATSGQPSAAAAASGAPAPAGADSAPSSEALGVLATIPEPLSPAERIPPPARGMHAPPAATLAASAGSDTGASADTAARTPADSSAGAAAAAAPADSSAAAPSDSTGAGVPVPAPTVPLGERAGAAGQALPESTLVPSARTPRAGAGSARPDTCWRLQIGAPPERAKAEALQDVATSQLLTPFVIELEKQRYKVRSRDCMGRSAVNALRARAQRSGFQGTFVIHNPVKARQP